MNGLYLSNGIFWGLATSGGISSPVGGLVQAKKKPPGFGGGRTRLTALALHEEKEVGAVCRLHEVGTLGGAELRYNALARIDPLDAIR